MMGSDESKSTSIDSQSETDNASPRAGAGSARPGSARPGSTRPGSTRPESGTKSSDAGIRRVFQSNAKPSGVMSKDDFMTKLFVETPAVGQLLYSYMSSSAVSGRRTATSEGLDLSGFTAAVHNVTSLGDEPSVADFYVKMSCRQSDSLSADNVAQLISVCCTVDCMAASLKPPSSKPDPVLDALCKSVLGSNADVPPSKFSNWCNGNCPLLFNGLHSYICGQLTGDAQTSQAGACSLSALMKSCQSGQSIASVSSVWVLSCVLSRSFFPDSPHSSSIMSLLMKAADPGGWYSIYDSGTQGLSVNRFQHHVMDYKGPTLMLLSFQNFLYVVALDTQWIESGKRWGGEDCMFVQLLPNFKLHQRGSGLMYFNVSDRSVAKGIAVGKDRTVFLKVDGELEKVNHYGVDIKLQALEIWGCGGQAIRDAQLKQKEWEKTAVSKEQNRKLVPTDWKDSPDRQLLELGGVETEHNQRTDT